MGAPHTPAPALTSSTGTTARYSAITIHDTLLRPAFQIRRHPCTRAAGNTLSTRTPRIRIRIRIRISTRTMWGAGGVQWQLPGRVCCACAVIACMGGRFVVAEKWLGISGGPPMVTHSYPAPSSHLAHTLIPHMKAVVNNRTGTQKGVRQSVICALLSYEMCASIVSIDMGGRSYK